MVWLAKNNIPEIGWYRNVEIENFKYVKETEERVDYAMYSDRRNKNIALAVIFKRIFNVKLIKKCRDKNGVV